MVSLYQCVLAPIVEFGPGWTGVNKCQYTLCVAMGIEVLSFLSCVLVIYLPPWCNESTIVSAASRLKFNPQWGVGSKLEYAEDLSRLLEQCVTGLLFGGVAVV